MNSAVSQVQNRVQRVYQEISKFKEGFEMKSAKRITKLNTRLHETLAGKAPAKFLRGLALGSLLAAAAVLPFGPAYADEPSRPLSSEQIVCYEEVGLCSNQFEALSRDYPVYHELDQVRGGHPLSREQIDLIQDYEIAGIHWGIDGQGVVVEVPIDGVFFDVVKEPASVSLSPADWWEYTEYGNNVSPFSISASVSPSEQIWCPEISGDCPTLIDLRVTQGKVRSPISGAEIEGLDDHSLVYAESKQGEMRAPLTDEQIYRIDGFEEFGAPWLTDD